MNRTLPLILILGLLFIAIAPRALAHAQSDSPNQAPLTRKEAEIQRATIFMAEKRYDAAIRAYQDLLKAEPKNAILLNMEGIAYLSLYNFDDARKLFERSAKADKRYLSAVNNLGMVAYYQKNYKRAVKEYKRASAIEPKQAGPHANMGYAYYAMNKYPESAAEFQKALELDPHILERNARVGTMMQDRTVANHGLFFYTMARVYAQKGDADHCAEYLRKSVDEGYKDVKKVKTDPVFKDMLEAPSMQAVLLMIFPEDQKGAEVQPTT